MSERFVSTWSSEWSGRILGVQADCMERTVDIEIEQDRYTLYCLNPEDARKLAASILRAADVVEGGVK